MDFFLILNDISFVLRGLQHILKALLIKNSQAC